MQYLSTRGGVPPVSFQDAALAGLAGDGGLYVPESIPTLDLSLLKELPYWQVAHSVMQPFCDLNSADLEKLCREAYGPGYGGEVAPLVVDPWGEQLELFHGPTYSFKDVAMQFLGKLLQFVLEQRNERCNLLVATSGDTGSAALRSVVGQSRLQAVVMFPKGRVSATQELQMTTLLEPNTHCLEIEGTFDDCQAILKAIHRNAEVKRRLHLGAVNSVNWARLLAQSVYYVWIWLRTQRPLNVVVPTGNFGNFLASWLAVQMGVPARRLAIATNENDIVHRYFESRSYRKGEVLETLAPAMDIQVASNLERFFYFAGGRDPQKIKAWMERFESAGQLETPALDFAGVEIVSGSATRAQILEAIASYERATGSVMCPHTAVAWHVSRQLEDVGPVTVVATAHPGKFAEAVSEALGQPYQGHTALLELRQRPARKSTLPAQVDRVVEWLETNLNEGR